ncbi:hypothetical protein FAI40_03970 [Acetobacteraceae bacterium]|nr:hypothetical protein FAI40_03970 [Acetobacteraceae bacterium]
MNQNQQATPRHLAKISEAEKEKRRFIIENAIHSQRLEGGDVSKDVQDNLDLYATGLMDLETVEKRALAHYKRNF